MPQRNRLRVIPATHTEIASLRRQVSQLRKELRAARDDRRASRELAEENHRIAEVNFRRCAELQADVDRLRKMLAPAPGGAVERF
jgi:hypothetical protein